MQEPWFNPGTWSPDTETEQIPSIFRCNPKTKGREYMKQLLVFRVKKYLH